MLRTVVKACCSVSGKRFRWRVVDLCCLLGRYFCLFEHPPCFLALPIKEAPLVFSRTALPFDKTKLICKDPCKEIGERHCKHAAGVHPTNDTHQEVTISKNSVQCIICAFGSSSKSDNGMAPRIIKSEEGVMHILPRVLFRGIFFSYLFV